MNEEIALLGVVRLAWLVQQLAGSLSHEDLLTFIKDLDLRVADYDFTKNLGDYCTAAIAAEDAWEIES